MVTETKLSGRSVREIAASVEQAIRENKLAPGTPLPSVRELAQQLNVSPATAASAYRVLRERAFIVTERRRGTRVSDRPALGPRPQPVVDPNVVNLASGNPDPALLPSLEAAIHKLKLPTRLYGEVGSLPELVDSIRQELGPNGPPADNAVVVAGGLDGIERVLEAHVRPGDLVAVEDPCYAGLIDLVRTLGMICLPVAIDSGGFHPEALEAALASDPAAVVLTPRAQNPTGAAIDEQRARELHDVLAMAPDLLVIESDHVGPISSMPRYTTIGERPHWALIRSVNKALGPDLRVGVVFGDETTVSRVEGRQSVGTGWVSHINQRLTFELLRDAEVDALVSSAATAYRERREALLGALAAHEIVGYGRTGFNVWIPVPEEDAVVQALLARGWAVRAGEPYRLESDPGIRATTSTLTAEDAHRFAVDLAKVLRPAHRSRLA